MHFSTIFTSLVLVACTLPSAFAAPTPHIIGGGFSDARLTDDGARISRRESSLGSLDSGERIGFRGPRFRPRPRPRPRPKPAPKPKPQPPKPKPKPKPQPKPQPKPKPEPPSLPDLPDIPLPSDESPTEEAAEVVTEAAMVSFVCSCSADLVDQRKRRAHRDVKPGGAVTVRRTIHGTVQGTGQIVD